MRLNPDTKKRIQKFKKNKRAFYSFWILSLSYIISLFTPLLINNKPLLVYYQKSFYFPIIKFYPETTFGGKRNTKVDYKKLNTAKEFSKKSSNFMIFPIIPYGYNEDFLNEFGDGVIPPTSPNITHWLGTDDRGRDVLSRIVYGFRLSMSFGLLLVLFELFLGTIIGGIQGYFSGIIDLSVQRFTEILSSIPFLYLILIMGSILGRSFSVLLITYGVVSWIGISYYIRGEFYKLRNQQFVHAAKAFGIPNYLIIFKHIIPNALTPLVTFLPFSLISSISILSALDFLGYGLPAPNPSWGELIAQGRQRLDAWWLITFPSLALFFTIQLTSFIGEGLRDAFDAKQKVVLK